MARDARWRNDRRYRRRPASDVGGAVLQARKSAQPHHIRRSWNHGLRVAGRDWRQSRASRREVWVVVGDGGFQMTLCELATIVQEKLNVNIAIINNGFLGMVRQWQEFFYE